MINKTEMIEKIKTTKGNNMPKVAETLYDNQGNNLTAMQIEEMTGINYDAVKQCIITLQRKYGFEFEKLRVDNRMAYKLIGLNGDTEKYKIRKSRIKEKPPLCKPKLHPLIEKVFR